MSKNSFKELELLEIKNKKINSKLIKTNLNENVKTFGFMANIIELYIPTLKDIFFSFTKKIKQ